MSQQTSHNRVLFPRALTSFRAGGFLASMVLVGFLLSLLTAFVMTAARPSEAAALTNSTLNFQARLENSTGSIAPDGYYNVQFKLYAGGTAGGPAGKGQANAGTNLWTETWYDSDGVGANPDNRIQVRNGYISANLGAQTAFPSTINWNEELWITLNIGGRTHTATPVYDGEMNPRLKLTGVPYAFQAGQLAQFNATTGFTSSLSLIQPTVGNQAFQIANQGAAGTYTLCVQGATTANGGCAPTTGGSGYIQNQNSVQQTSTNFWMNGTGRADTAFLAPRLDTATVTGLNIGNTNANAITIGNTANTATTSIIANTTLNLGSNANNKTINIGATGTTNNTTIVNIATSTANNQTVNIGSTFGTSTTTIYSGSGSIVLNSGGTIELQDSTNVTGNLSATGNIQGGTMNSFRIATPTNAVVNTDTMAIAQSPVAGSLWHDLLAFNKYATPTFEQHNGTTWGAATLNSNLFAQKESQSVNIINGTTTTAARWTWNSGGLSWSAGEWLNIGFAYSATSATKTILFESSADGVVWTTRHTSTGNNQNAAPAWFYVSNYSGDPYLRLTVTGTTAGSVNLSAIKLLTARWGDQGGGSELSYPYTWDASQNITTGGTLTSNGNLTVGNSGNLIVGGQQVITSGGILQNVTASAGILTSGTVATGLLSGSYTGITGVGTITTGVWNGTAITDTYVSDTLTVGSAGSVAWSALNAYPTACAAGTAITALNDTPTCSTFATTDTNTTYTNGTDLTLTGTTFGLESQIDSVSILSRASSNLTLQTTTSGNIILNSAGTIELQDNTNITGNLTISGEVQAGSMRTYKGTMGGTETNQWKRIAAIPASNGMVQIDGNLGGHDLDTAGEGQSWVDLGVSYRNGYKLYGTVTGRLPTDTGARANLIMVTDGTNLEVYVEKTNWTQYALNLRATGNASLVDDAWTSTDPRGRVGWTTQYELTDHLTLAGGSTITYSGSAFLATSIYGGNLGIAGGDLLFGGVVAITSARVLQNVTADAGILTSGTVATGLLSGSYTGITGVGTITAGTWNGTAIDDAYVSDTLTIGSASSIAWSALNAYPTACAAGTAITALNDTPTCTAFAPGSGSGSYIQNQNSAAQTSSNYWISGTGRASTSYIAPAFDSSGTAALSFGNSANAKAITIGNATGATSVAVNCGTGACSFGNNATAHQTVVGSATTTSQTIINAGTTGLNLGNNGVANTIQIGNTTGAVAQNIRIGNNATASSSSNVIIGSLLGASSTTIQAGTGNIILNGGGTIELQDATNVTGALTATGTVQGTRLISTIATGTAPLTITSTTLVTNLNADMLDGLHASSFAASTGSASYIQNQNAAAQNAAGFWVDGNGRIDGDMQAEVGIIRSAPGVNWGFAFNVQRDDGSYVLEVDTANIQTRAKDLLIINRAASGQAVLINGGTSADTYQTITSTYFTSTVNVITGVFQGHGFVGTSSVHDFKIRTANESVARFGTTAFGNGLWIKGTIQQNQAAPDIAEHIPVAPDVEAWDVVMPDPNSTERAVKATGAYTDAAIGVISDGTSGMIINPYGNVDGGMSRNDTKPIVLAGRVPIKVTNDGGPIRPGDNLAVSSTPGHAMKATRAGATVAKSLGFFDGTTGTVLAQILTSYYDPNDGDNIQADSGNINSLQAETATIGSLQVDTATFGGLNVSGMTTLKDLQVTGDAAIEGNLAVGGKLITQDIVVEGHIMTKGMAPATTIGIAAGAPQVINNVVQSQTMPVITIDGNDSAGTLTIKTGHNSTTSGVLAHVSFANGYENNRQKIVISANNGAASKLDVYVVKTATGFDIVTDDVSQASTEYMFDYIVLGAEVASGP